MGNLSYSESIVVAAPVDTLYGMVSDVTRMGEWSPVCEACWWDADATAQVGASFTGRNQVPGRTWETRSKVVAAEPGKEFAFVVGDSYVRWSYHFSDTGEGTRVTESWEFLPAGIAAFRERYGADAAAQIAESA